MDAWGDGMRTVNIEGRVVNRPAYAHDVDTGEQVAVFDIVADRRKVTVICHGDLAKNVSLSLYVGDAVTVYGDLEQLMGRFRMVATLVGHDLNVGTSVFNEPTGWITPIKLPSRAE